MVEITGETSFWTGIKVANANDEVIFDGMLKREPDGWCLYSTRKHPGGEIVHKFAARRSWLGAIAASIQWIEKNTGYGG
jgi:hypothetical protein